MGSWPPANMSGRSGGEAQAWALEAPPPSLLQPEDLKHSIVPEYIIIVYCSSIQYVIIFFSVFLVNLSVL